jgi:hypothetical protein
MLLWSSGATQPGADTSNTNYTPQAIRLCGGIYVRYTEHIRKLQIAFVDPPR